MSTLGERKSALLLMSLHPADRRQLLARLPRASARTLRALIAELERSPLPVAQLAEAVLADEVRGLTASTSLRIEQLVALSERLSPAWFARVLLAWTGVDRSFCLSLLDERRAAAVREELRRLDRLPPKLVEALREESLRMAEPEREAA
ncbi:hypothetical protein A7A76_04320 [Lysobacter enzymogenes]|uniref:hypothetical protein n=1 Tax=Lysobacter enzymogenes TaxID=69 RepID=UPI0019D2ED10|nr:hypothetical protein [Lysobacter enzymogenes]MBN7138314.1 hypothetical protein [Lysobacter enzymogenes]